MASLNKVMIMGRLGQDPEMRYTQSQVAVCTLNVATTEYRTGQDGNRQESTEWHRVVVWRQQAENCGKYLSKGSPVFIEGKLQTRSWDDKDGKKCYTTEIVANGVQFLPTGQSQKTQQTNNQSQPNNNQSQAYNAPQNNMGFPQNSGFDSSMANQQGTASMDDIPF